MKIRWLKQTARIDRIKGNVANLPEDEALAEVVLGEAELETGQPTEEQLRAGAAAYVRAAEGLRRKLGRPLAAWLAPLYRREAYGRCLTALYPDQKHEIERAVGAPQEVDGG